MKTTRTTSLCSLGILAAMTLVAACGKKSDDDSSADSSAPVKSTATATATATPAPTPTVTETAAPPPAKPGIDAHVKAELDNRSDGLAGNTLTSSGAQAAIQSPSTWQTTPKGDITISGTPDQKSALAVAESDGGDAKRDAAVAALGLTNCQWGNPESVTVGKDKLSASATDGLCQRGATPVSTAYVNDAGDKLVIVGAWDKAGGDLASVFGGIRGIVKVKPGGDASGIGPCCDALAGNAKSAPPAQQGSYMAAAAACNLIRSNPQARQMLGQVRAALAGANMPSSCK